MFLIRFHPVGRSSSFGVVGQLDDVLEERARSLRLRCLRLRLQRQSAWKLVHHHHHHYCRDVARFGMSGSGAEASGSFGDVALAAEAQPSPN